MNLIRKMRLRSLIKKATQGAITRKRITAIKRLGESGEPVAFDILVSSLKSGFDSLTLASCEALGNLGDKRATDILLNLLYHNNPGFRKAAADSLARRGEPQWQEIVRGDDKDIENLACSEDERVIRSLITNIIYSWDGSPQIQLTLGKAKNHVTRKVLLNFISDPNLPKKHFLLEILGEMQNPDDTDLFLDFINSGDKEIRKASVVALDRIGDRSAIEKLISRLTDSDGSVRIQSAEALAGMGEPHWKNFVKGDYNDFERLGESGDQRILQSLIKILKIDTLKENKLWIDAARAAAARGLGKLDNSEAIEPLNEALADSGHVRKAAAGALAELGWPMWKNLIKGNSEDYGRLGTSSNPVAVKILINIINNYFNILNNNTDWELRSKISDENEIALKALGKINDDEAVGFLIEALSNVKYHYTIRIKAAKALGEAGNPLAVEALIDSFETLDRTPTDCIIIIIEALGKIRDKRAVKALVSQIEKEGNEIASHISKYNEKNPDWKLMSSPYRHVKQREEKMLAIARALDSIGGSETVEPLISLLNFKTSVVRKAAARILVNLAKNDFSIVSSKWKTISESIQNPHRDHEGGIDYTHQNDCGHNDTFIHIDYGIGLKIPKELK
ncbi:MAG: HEAT repeat domain-containing protein [Bacteroidales bacterium]|jgi:HEAT repeat protein